MSFLKRIHRNLLAIVHLLVAGANLEFYCEGCEVDLYREKFFECITCDDYCICETCERQGAHLEHNMICIKNNNDTVCVKNLHAGNLYSFTGYMTTSEGVRYTLHRNREPLLPPATKLRQDNVFAPVCHSVHREGGLCPGVRSQGVSVSDTPPLSMVTYMQYTSY